jgi:hypothetical protein
MPARENVVHRDQQGQAANMDEKTKERRMALLWPALILLFGVAIACWQLASNPLRKSNASIREWLFSKTPPGSRIDEVRQFLDERGWDNPQFHKRWPPPADEPFLGGEIGSYQGLPWWITVRAFWEFDDTGRLTDIQIERIHDSP